MGIGKIVRVVLDEGLTAGKRVGSAAADRWRGKRGTEKPRGSAEDRRERDRVRGKSADEGSTSTTTNGTMIDGTMIDGTASEPRAT